MKTKKDSCLVFIIIFCVFSTFSIKAQVTEKVVKQPNIILIMVDDLGYECIGAYGSTSYKTPNIDKLAATGMLFNQAYAQPLCSPTRLKLMTGK